MDEILPLPIPGVSDRVGLHKQEDAAVPKPTDPVCPLPEVDEVREVQCLVECDQRRSHDTALGYLYDHHAARLAEYARRIVGTDIDAQDVVQDVLVKAWRRADGYDRTRGTVGVWLTAMARSRALEVLRGRRAAKRQPRLDVTQPTWAAPAQISDPDYGLLRASISSLPDTQRAVVDLAYFEGLTHSEIAKTTGLPIGTVKTRLLMAVRTLRLTVRREPLAALVRGRMRAEQQRVSRWVSDRVLGQLADLYFIDVVLDGGTVQRTTWGHVDPAVKQDLDQIWRFVPGAASDHHPVRQVLAAGQPQFVSHTGTRWQTGVATSAQHLRFMQQLQLQSLICQPIGPEGSPIGSLTMVRTTVSGAHYRAQNLYETRQVARVIGTSLQPATTSV
ncbi:MAG: sigma-70 family RNA polymerase sigma factor [Vicinamibacterales bacterium]